MLNILIICYSTTNLDPSILGKLVAKRKITNRETTKLVKAMTWQLMANFDKPGASGATSQWCKKLICLYPSLADDGETMGEKTV